MIDIKAKCRNCGTFTRIEDDDLKRIYEKGRAEELDKIDKMILLGCEELKCDECDYRLYSQDVCQQAYTIGIIENYIAEQLKE